MAEKCKICLVDLAEGVKHCINCGAEVGAVEPRTIEEFKAYCEARKLPTEKMRFFIGENYTEPKAFGIYEDGAGEFVVYKNKADGSRAVRYRGAEEAFAVRELFLRMQQEVGNQRARSAQAKSDIRGYVDRSAGGGGSRGGGSSRKKSGRVSPTTVGVIAVVAALVCAVGIFIGKLVTTPYSGYYNYEGDYYYNSGGTWYVFDDEYDTWSRTYGVDGLKSSFKDYYAGYDYSGDYGIEDFRDSEYYHPYSGGDYDDDSGYSYDYDYDSSDDWSYDDWDSDYTDWDSDW